jgi:formate hydrogenlyase transcriptional activator
MASSKTAMSSERLVSMAPASADNYEALLRDARDTADRLRLILDINNTIVANLELQDLLHAVSASLRRALQCDAAAITVADTQAGCLRFHAVDFPESFGVARPGQVMPIEGTLLGEVFKTGKPALHSLANGIDRDGVAGPEGVRFGCAVPLFGRNKALGVLSVGRRDAPPFTERDLELLVQLSTQVGIALDNSMAWGQINDLKNQLAREKVYLEDEIRSEMQFREIVGKTKALREILQEVEVVAPTDSTVLIHGGIGPQPHPSFIEVSDPPTLRGGSGEVAGTGKDGTNVNGCGG